MKSRIRHQKRNCRSKRIHRGGVSIFAARGSPRQTTSDSSIKTKKNDQSSKPSVHKTVPPPPPPKDPPPPSSLFPPRSSTRPLRPLNL